VIHIQQAIPPPGQARREWEIYCDLAARLGQAERFTYDSSRAIFEELREASRGGIAD
jgi:assimilatory nitrate reductase catalytic subunit